MQYLSRCDWLISLNTLFSRFIHVVRISFLFKAESYSMVGRDHNLFIHSSLHKHWVAFIFWLLWIMLLWTQVHNIGFILWKPKSHPWGAVWKEDKGTSKGEKQSHLTKQPKLRDKCPLQILMETGPYAWRCHGPGAAHKLGLSANINSLLFFNMWYGPNTDNYKSNPMYTHTHTHTHTHTRWLPQPCWGESLITNKQVPTTARLEHARKVVLEKRSSSNTGTCDIQCGAHISHQATVLSLSSSSTFPASTVNLDTALTLSPRSPGWEGRIRSWSRQVSTAGLLTKPEEGPSQPDAVPLHASQTARRARGWEFLPARPSQGSLSGQQEHGRKGSDNEKNSDSTSHERSFWIGAEDAD